MLLNVLLLLPLGLTATSATRPQGGHDLARRARARGPVGQGSTERAGQHGRYMAVSRLVGSRAGSECGLRTADCRPQTAVTEQGCKVRSGMGGKGLEQSMDRGCSRRPRDAVGLTTAVSTGGQWLPSSGARRHGRRRGGAIDRPAGAGRCSRSSRTTSNELSAMLQCCNGQCGAVQCGMLAWPFASGVVGGSACLAVVGEWWWWYGAGVMIAALACLDGSGTARCNSIWRAATAC